MVRSGQIGGGDGESDAFGSGSRLDWEEKAGGRERGGGGVPRPTPVIRTTVLAAIVSVCAWSDCMLAGCGLARLERAFFSCFITFARGMAFAKTRRQISMAGLAGEAFLEGGRCMALLIRVH